MVMFGCSFSNAATSAFQSRSSSACAPTGWQSTVMTTLPAASGPAFLAEQAARASPNPAASASAATFRECGADICSSLQGNDRRERWRQCRLADSLLQDIDFLAQEANGTV